MSKFFAQLLLSTLIGVGTAAGFRSDVRGEVNKALRGGKVSFQETAKITLESPAHVETQVNTAVSVSAKADANLKTSIKHNAKADAKAKGNIDMQVSTAGDLLDAGVSPLSLDGSTNTNSQTNVGADAQGLGLDLKNNARTALDVGLDILK